MQEIIDRRIRFIPKKAPSFGSILSPNLFINKNKMQDNWFSVKGLYTYDHKQSTACGFAANKNEFHSTHNNTTFPIHNYINCNSKFVIYLITCVVYRSDTTAGVLKYLAKVKHSV